LAEPRKFFHALGSYDMVRLHGRASSSCCRRTFWTAAAEDTRERLRTTKVTWIERTYHRRAAQPPPGRLTRIEYGHHVHTDQSGRVTDTVT